MIDPIKLLEEAESLVQHYGFTWERGNKRGRSKPVIPELARRHNITERWVLKKLGQGKKSRKLVAAPIQRNVGLGRAFAQTAGRQIVAPASAIPQEVPPQPGQPGGSALQALRAAAVHVLRDPRKAPPMVVEMCKALIDEIPK